MSLSPEKIREFGDTLWRLKGDELQQAAHVLIEHQELLTALSQTIKETEKADRTRAIQAMHYARLRKEGLVDWRFDISGVERENLLEWAAERIRPFFARV